MSQTAPAAILLRRRRVGKLKWVSPGGPGRGKERGFGEGEEERGGGGDLHGVAHKLGGVCHLATADLGRAQHRR